jgi:preprotein translocase subunit SecY
VSADQLNRVWFTLGALLVYRIGSYIPLPGIDIGAWQRIFDIYYVGSILGAFNMFAAGGVQRLAIFALSIMPYVSAAILIQIATMVLPTLKQLRMRGESGRATIDLYTRYLTFVLAAGQAYGIAIGLEGVSGVVGEPGLFFRLSTVVTLVGGTMFLVWLTDQITARGIGNGLSLLLFAGMMVELPSALANMFELGLRGVLSNGSILVVLVMTVAVTAFIVFMERARRWLLIQYPERPVGGRTVEGRASPVPLKLNMSGLIPALFASGLTALLVAVANLRNPPMIFLLYFGLIVFFAFLYARFVFNPAAAAENLKEHGGFIPGIESGEPTARRIDHVVTRLTTIGAMYFALVCLIPEMLAASAGIPFYVGGTNLLVVVCVTLDIQTQLEAEAERST